MDYAQLADRFWEQGYLVVEDMFDADLMDRYQALILEHFGESLEAPCRMDPECTS